MTSRSEIQERIDSYQPGEPTSEFDHAMIDIETMSLHPHRAMILSIGMVEFDPRPLNKMRVGSRSLLVLNPIEQLSLGRRVSPSTQKWWAAQPEKAREHWQDCPPEAWFTASAALDLVTSFVRGKSRVWANGTQFDLSNLQGLKEDVDERDKFERGELWHYQAPRDMRTFARENTATRIMNMSEAFTSDSVPHEPVHDCLVQAFQVWERWDTEKV